MNEIPTEKLLPQGLKDMLNAKRKCMAQANDIHNEIIDREMKTIHLPLKAQWYEMIESGVKTEEYREIKPYWAKRFCITRDDGIFIECKLNDCISCIKGDNPFIFIDPITLYRMYDYVKFSYGYTKRTMTFEIKEITIGKGNPEWGAPKEDVFIIKLGNKVIV